MAKVFKMNEIVKKKWIQALRSGKYKQTQGSLKDSDGFCCLGVLCDLYQKEKKKKIWLDNIFMDEDYYLPVKVLKWLNNDKNKYKDYVFNDYEKIDITKKLVRMNDEGKKFTEIADYLEKRKTL